MKTLTARRQINLPTNLEVNDFEETYGILLPQDFKDFLSQYNQIDCEENLFTLDGEKFYLDVFYPLPPSSLRLLAKSFSEFTNNLSKS